MSIKAVGKVRDERKVIARIKIFQCLEGYDDDEARMRKAIVLEAMARTAYRIPEFEK